MKKIFNNKGMTLVEIILSIGLVSIVMVQVLNILVDLKDEQLLGKDKTHDLTNRSIIIKSVQEDIRTHQVASVANCGAGDSTDLGPYTKKSCFRMDLKTGASTTVYKMFTASKGGYDYFIYGYQTASGFKYEAWKLISGTYQNVNSCNYLFVSASTEGKNYFRIYFPVVLTKANQKSTMNFDLEFLYYYDGPSNITVNGLNSANLLACKTAT